MPYTYTYIYCRVEEKSQHLRYLDMKDVELFLYPGYSMGSSREEEEEVISLYQINSKKITKPICVSCCCGATYIKIYDLPQILFNVYFIVGYTLYLWGGG